MIAVGRNVGGSVGIAMVQALLARREQFHQERLVSGLQPLNAPYEHAVHVLTRLFLSRGAAPAAAAHMAVGQIYAWMHRQAMMMSFDDVFRALMIFVIVISPLLLLLRPPPAHHGRRAAAAADAEPVAEVPL
jgi:DHA2 family multidrug resistance protein